MALYGTVSPGSPLGFRNYIINGNFDIWQRGTSTTTMTAYLADRWQGQTGTTGTQSQQTFTAGQTDVPGEPTYFLRWNKTGTADYSVIAQKIEDVRSLAGKTATLSFYAKAGASLTLAIRIVQDFGSGGSSGVQVNDQTVALTTSWTKYTLTFSIPSVSGKTIGTSSFLQLYFLPGNSSTASTHTFDLAQVQLEEGSIATIFERRHIGQELQLCQRYYFKRSGVVEGGGLSVALPAIDTIIGVQHNFPVEMRTTPSLTMLGTTGRSGGVTSDQRISTTHFVWGNKQTGSGTANVYAFATGGFEVSAEF